MRPNAAAAMTAAVVRPGAPSSGPFVRRPMIARSYLLGNWVLVSPWSMVEKDHPVIARQENFDRTPGY
jgi:hypothetical protein